MTKVILDTNVVVAAFRSRQGASAAIVAMVGAGRFELYMSVALALEYEHVLKRHAESVGLRPRDIDDFVSRLCALVTRYELPASPWPLVSDPGDEFLARLAVAAGCNFLVTHNLRHLQSLEGTGISVVTPGRFLSIIKAVP